MAGKKNDEKKEDSSWVDEVEKYSRQIWLAGLGAYSKISNDGTKLFETLVKDGEKAEKAAKSGVDKQVDAVKSTTKSRVGDVKERALGKWGKLEEAFDKRLNSAISRLGVPSRNEIKALHSQVDTLTKQIERLTGASVTSVTAKPAVSKPAAKAAPKPAVVKPAVKAETKTAAAKPAVAKKPAVRKAAAPKSAAVEPVTPAPIETASAAPASVATPAPAVAPELSPANQS